MFAVKWISLILKGNWGVFSVDVGYIVDFVGSRVSEKSVDFEQLESR